MESLGRQIAQKIKDKVVSQVQNMVGASGSKDTDAAVKKEIEEIAASSNEAASSSKAAPPRPLRLGSTVGSSETKAKETPSVIKVGSSVDNADHVAKCVDQSFDMCSVSQFVYDNKDSQISKFLKDQSLGAYKFNLLSLIHI